MPNITPIILSGGNGSRLWPLSTPEMPKQFLALISKRSLFQETLIRLNYLSFIASPIVICNHIHSNLVRMQSSEIQVSPTIITEPIGRNTAPAIAIAAMYLTQHHDDPIMLILPADHAIKDTKAFHIALKNAQNYAEHNNLVTFGIKPNRPETGYGYIKSGQKIGHNNAYEIAQFAEKPDLITAQNYLKSGHYHWNSGIFMFRAQIFLQELQIFAPDIFNACQTTLQYSNKLPDELILSSEYFPKCPSDSIDYAVMEKTHKGVMIPLDAGWSDIGSWQALHEYKNNNSSGNILEGDIIAEEIKNSYIFTEKVKILAIGLENIIIVEKDGKILVMDKNSKIDFKKCLEKI